MVKERGANIMKKNINYLKNSNVENFMKLIMLTFFACCVTMIFVGCENGNKNIDKNKLTSSEIDLMPISRNQDELDVVSLSGELNTTESRGKNKRTRRSL